MARAIQDFNFFYTILRPLVNFSTKCHYHRIEIRGKQNLPKEGGYIMAPCHQQALMEPLAVLATADKPPVFLARADIFAKPTVRAILTFLRILPVYRIRDGKESLSKNAEIFLKSRNVILDGYPLCLMAEGRHNNRHQLLPLVKGMFRIAGETQKQLGDTPLYIVPCGIDFDEYELPYSNLCVNIGKPIPVQPFMPTFVENEPVALNQMRAALTPALQGQMFDIRSQACYDEFYTLCNILNKPQRKALNLRNNPWNRFTTRQSLAHKLDAIEAQGGEKLQSIVVQAQSYTKQCAALKLQPTLTAEHWSLPLFLFSILAMAGIAAACVLSKPILMAALFYILCYPIAYLPTHLIPRKIIKDSQFRSSINFGIRFGFSIIYTLVFSIVMLCTRGGMWGSMLPQLCGFCWFLIALVVPFFAAHINRNLVYWFRKHNANGRYWTRALFQGKKVRALTALRSKLYAEVSQ